MVSGIAARKLAEPDDHGFQETEFGLMPDDWTPHSIEDVSAFITKGSTPTTYGFKWESVGVLFLRSECVAESGLDLAQAMRISPIAHNMLRRSAVKSGDVLITITGNVGRAIIFDSEEEANINQHIARVRIDDNNVNPRYLLQWLSQPCVRAHFLSITTGQAYPQISLKQVRKHQFFLPPTNNEQWQIAEALSDADSLIEALERLIAKKRDIKNGIMQRILGESESWNETSLFEICDKRKDLFDDGDWIESEHIAGDGVRLIQTGNIGIGKFIEKDTKKYIFESSFAKLRCKELRVGDLLICRLADPAGRACILPNIGEGKIVTSVDVTICRPPEGAANRVFLANLFCTKQWFQSVSDRSGGTTHKRIARGALGKIRFKLPPIELQNDYAQVLQDIDDDVESLMAKLSKAYEIKQGMMQELLTGRIRLV